MMKSIYLDTSNIALLTKIQNKSPERFQSFHDLWVKNNLVLALSKAHFFEIVRHGSQEEIELRFNLIENLLPIRTEMSLLNKEILLAFTNKSILTFNEEFQPHIFGDLISTPEDFFQFRAFNLGFMRDIFNWMYAAHTASWGAYSSAQQLKDTKVPRLRDLSNQELPNEEVFGFQENYQKIVNDLIQNLGIPEELLQQGFDSVNENIEQLQLRANEGGFLEAFSEFIDVDSKDNKTLKKPIDTLLREFWFKTSVKNAISEVCEDYDLVNSLVTKISIEDCPGTWLNKKVEFQLKRSGDLSTSNELDIEHISHLPYVDRLFADKRIVTMTKQVLASKDKPEQLENIFIPIAIPNTIEALEEALFN